MKKNLIFRRNLIEAGDRSPVVAKAIYKMCSEDILFFLNFAAFTFDSRDRTTSSVIPFITYPYQDTAILEIVDVIGSRDLFIEKSRDMGASWIILYVFHWFWLFWPGSTFGIGSRNADYVDKPGDEKALFFKLDFINKYLPQWLLSDSEYSRVKFHMYHNETNSQIAGESTTGEFFRGARPTAIMIDELASFKLNDGFEAVRSSWGSTDCRIFNSTYKGNDNAFAEIAMDPDIKKISMHWSLHPRKSPGLYTTKDGEYVSMDDVSPINEKEMQECDKIIGSRGVRLYDGKLRSPWYAKECKRAMNARHIATELDMDMMGTTYQFFHTDDLVKLKNFHCKVPLYCGDLSVNYETGRPSAFEPSIAGPLRLWFDWSIHKTPPSDRNYVIGVDISAGTGTSNSAASVFDLKTQEKVAEYVSPKVRPDQFARIVCALGWWFCGSTTEGAFVVPESNGGHGITFINTMVEYGYLSMYYRRDETSLKVGSSHKPGWFASPATVLALMQAYKSALTEEKFINRSFEAIDECRYYIYDGNSVVHSASRSTIDPSGARHNHGDRVRADALAWKGALQRGHMMARPDTIVDNPDDPPYGSLAWRNKFHAEKERALLEW